MKTWEKIAERTRRLPPDKQQQVLDYVEFLGARGNEAGPAPSSDAATSWPGTRFAPDRGESSPRDSDRPAGLDEFLTPPPRRHVGQMLLGILLFLALGAVGGFLYYRYGMEPESVVDATAPETSETLPAVAVAADVGQPAEVALSLPSLAPPPAAIAPDAGSLLLSSDTTAPPQDAGLALPDPDAPGTASEDGVPEAGATCPGGELDEARGLWLGRDRDGALQKLREAIRCAPTALDPLLQWGRWVMDTPALYRDRANCADGAAALQPAADANPDHGELWFHYTNLLFGAGRREDALAAKQHCLRIRPSSEYSASCRYLPQ